MGFKPFMLRIDAASPEEAFEILFNDAKKMFGENPHSGTIATCQFGECKGEFLRYLVYNENKACDKVRELDGGEIGVADFIDLGQAMWRISTPVQRVLRYTGVTRQKFVVTDEEKNIFEPMEAHIFTKKSSADAKAIELVRNRIVPVAYVRKMQVLLSGNEVMSIIEQEIKYRHTKHRPTKGLTPYSTVEPIHKYLFFGKGKT